MTTSSDIDQIQLNRTEARNRRTAVEDDRTVFDCFCRIRHLKNKRCAHPGKCPMDGGLRGQLPEISLKANEVVNANCRLNSKV